MSHNAELKKAAEGAVNAGSHWGRRDSFERQLAKLATPDVILALIAENERLAANMKLNLCDHPAIHQGDVDLLVAFVTGTSQMELAKVHGCTPPNISRKIRRVKDRLGWREGMLVPEIRDRAEQLRALASQGAVVTADLMSERDQLRAEVAGLRTGYEAYERVNAELKAEVEKLRKYGEEFAVLAERRREEADALRKDSESYRLLSFCHGQGTLELVRSHHELCAEIRRLKILAGEPVPPTPEEFIGPSPEGPTARIRRKLAARGKGEQS